jgi:hypothetical protein
MQHLSFSASLISFGIISSSSIHLVTNYNTSFLLLCWGYIVAFTKVLTMYCSWMHLLHHSPSCPCESRKIIQFWEIISAKKNQERHVMSSWMTSSQSIRTALIKSEEDDQCGKDAEDQVPAHCLWEFRWIRALWKTVWRFHLRTNWKYNHLKMGDVFISYFHYCSMGTLWHLQKFLFNIQFRL